MKILLLVLLISLGAFSAEKKVSSPDYSDAQDAKEFIRFDMESSKLGMFTSSFDGFVREFTVSYEKKGVKFSDAKISFAALKLVTGSNARDKKMHEKCLEYKKFPQVNISLGKNLSVGNHPGTPIVIDIRGKKKKALANIRIQKTATGHRISGEALLKISKLEIPDPSIAIAKVADDIKVHFSFEILN